MGTALGVAPLTEEDARNYSIGFTLQASDQLLLTVDAFRIDIDDRIGISESLQGDTLIATVQDLPGGEGVRSVSFFTNAIDTRTEGIELVADWNVVRASGRYSINAAYSFIDTHIRKLRDAPQSLRDIDPGAQLFESGARNVLTTASPRHKGLISGNWQNNNWNVLTRVRHYGTVERDRGFASQRFSPDTLVDMAVTRQLSNNLSVTAGADNVFDRRAQRSSENLDFGGNFAYEVITPAGANGRFIYANVRYSF